MNKDIGEIKTGSLLLRQAAPNRFDVRVAREYLENYECDCPETAIEDWLRLEIGEQGVAPNWVR